MARAVIREGAVWVDARSSGGDTYPWEWSTAIDVIANINVVVQERVVETAYVPASEEWEPEKYRQALLDVGWTVTTEWDNSRSATVEKTRSW